MDTLLLFGMRSSVISCKCHAMHLLVFSAPYCRTRHDPDLKTQTKLLWMTTASTYSSSPFSPVISLPAAGIRPTRLKPSLSQMAREALLAVWFQVQGSGRGRENH